MQRRTTWIKNHLKNYIGKSYDVLEYNEKIYIGSDLPDEFTGSNYTKSLRVKIAKAKANAIIGLPEMIQIATNATKKPNFKKKHSKRAKQGWYKYQTQFALPEYNNDNMLTGYRIWTACLLVNQNKYGRKYLYDVVDIKKEAGTPLQND